MIKKILKALLIVISIALFTGINISNVRAEITVNCVRVGGGGGGGSTGGGCAPGRHVFCNIKNGQETEEVKLKEDLYDSKGNFIGSATQFQDKLLLVSGKFIGIDAYEEYRKTFYVTANPECVYGEYVTKTVNVEYTCTYMESYWYPCGYDSKGFALYCPGTRTWTETCLKPETVTTLECSSCGVSVSECRDEADQRLERLVHSVNLEPSYVGYRQDVNDIDKGTKNGEPQIAIYESSKYIDYGVSEPADRNSSTVWRTATMRYGYNLAPAWIDSKTGKVKYEIDSTGNQVTADDKKTYNPLPQIKTQYQGTSVQVGQYFVPLNTKSTDIFKYNLLPRLNRPALSEELCISLIDKYSTRTDKNDFWGDIIARKGDGSPLYKIASTAAAAKNVVRRENGCRLALYLTFKIEQSFYKDGNGSLKGYEFYYRPIDYSEPFPNGIAVDGFWIDHYDKATNSTKVVNSKGQLDRLNSQDLDNSFSKITYRTNDKYNVGTIRDYNNPYSNPRDERKYNSWDEMKPDGTSTFITKGYGVTRNGCQSFYAIGCGPANIDWPQCKITEVCK